MREHLLFLVESFSLEVGLLTRGSAAFWWHILFSERSFQNALFSSLSESIRYSESLSFSWLPADQANNTALCLYICLAQQLSDRRPLACPFSFHKGHLQRRSVKTDLGTDIRLYPCNLPIALLEIHLALEKSITVHCCCWNFSSLLPWHRAWGCFGSIPGLIVFLPNQPLLNVGSQGFSFAH